MSVPTQKTYNNQFANVVPGEIVRLGDAAADLVATATKSFTADKAFKIDSIADAYLNAPNTGTDGSNPLSVELDVLIGGVSIFSTKPSIDKTATDGATTRTAATGVVVGVIDTTKNVGALGDVVTVTITLTRTASPADEMVVDAVVKLSALADYDSDMTVERLA